MLTNSYSGVSNAIAQKVVIVNGGSEILSLLETVLDAGHYDIVFVESAEHAYSQIKRVQPNLVLLYMQMDDIHGFQVLSMLKLDEETRKIPVLTYAAESNGTGSENDVAEESTEPEVFHPKSAIWMN